MVIPPRLNGVTDLIMTKADVLSDLDQINLCTDYVMDRGAISREVPYELSDIERPHYQTFDGWKQDLTEVRDRENLPVELTNYVKYIETYLRTPLSYLSVGPDRQQTIVM
jgi:adenylosuccinate synthase